MMSLIMLPLELLDAVCENLPLGALARLSYTSSSVYPAVQRQLYRHVDISPARRNLGIVLTMARKPEIARHVRSFSIDLDSYSTLLRPFYQQLACALSSMSELTSLHLFVDPSASWVLDEMISCSRLVHFACLFSLDSHVSSFLERTPALLELEVDSMPFRHEGPTSVLTTSAIPQLQQFIGSSQAAEAIIPSRPLTSVQLTAGDLTEDVVTRLSESTASISTLSATTSSAPAALLQTLSLRMQCLVYVRLKTTYNFPEAPDVNFYEHIAGFLYALPALQTFELSGIHWGSQERKDSTTQRVWQSQPLKSELDSDPDVLLDIDPYSDLFFGY